MTESVPSSPDTLLNWNSEIHLQLPTSPHCPNKVLNEMYEISVGEFIKMDCGYLQFAFLGGLS